MKKIYEAPSVEMTRFASEDTMATVFASGITKRTSINDATVNLEVNNF